MRGIVPVVGVLLILRIIAPILLSSHSLNAFGNPHKYDVIHEYCGKTPAIFVGSFQEPSLYHFYTEEDALLISSVYNRQTQFDLWQLDKTIQGKPAYIINTNVYDRGPKAGFDLIEKDEIAFYLHKTESFQGTNRIQVAIDQYRVANDSLYLDLTLSNPYETDFVFNNPEFPITLHVVYLRNSDCYPITCPIGFDMVIPAGGSLSCKTVVKYIPDAPIVICLDNIVNRSVNSKPLKLKQ